MRNYKTGELSQLHSEDGEIERLQEFLDSNNNVEIIEQASFLAASENPKRREAALEALTWVSTPKAGAAMLPLLNDPDTKITEAAFDSLRHVLSTISARTNSDPETGELTTEITADNSENGGDSDWEDEEDVDDSDELDLGENYDLWLAAFKALDDEDRIDLLMLDLSVQDERFAVPLLVDLLESGLERLSVPAAEYLDMVTFREGVTNREEAQLWLQKNYGSDSKD